MTNFPCICGHIKQAHMADGLCYYGTFINYQAGKVPIVQLSCKCQEYKADNLKFLEQKAFQYE